jgi:hypothetical protein
MRRRGVLATVYAGREVRPASPREEPSVEVFLVTVFIVTVFIVTAVMITP